MDTLITKVIPMGAIVLGVILGIVGCAAATSYENPATIKGSDSTSSQGYTIEYVEIEDGTVVKCLFHDAGSYSATMSCDFAAEKN